MSDLFEVSEDEKTEPIVEEKPLEPLEVVEPLEEVVEKTKKVKKPRKPLTEARKIQLREQLKIGRLRSLEKRQGKKKEKELVKVKEEEIVKEVEIKKKMKNQEAKELELEERLTKRIHAKIEKENEEKRTRSEIEKLREQVKQLTANRKETIQQVAPEVVIEKPIPKAKERKQVTFNKFSPYQDRLMFQYGRFKGLDQQD